MLETITERLGVRGVALVDTLDDPTALERRVARMLQGYREYLRQHVVFDDANARRALPRELSRRATPSAAALHALIDLALTIQARSRARAATRGPLEAERGVS